MSANQDYKDLFKILNEEAVEYLIVGAHAVIFYAEPRYTKDMDVWVRPTLENAQRLWKALSRFGAPLQDVSIEDFTDKNLVYQIGIEPNRIDVLMDISGVEFEAAIKRKQESTYDGIKIFVIGKEDLIKAKKTTARKQDVLDIEKLEEGKQ